MNTIILYFRIYYDLLWLDYCRVGFSEISSENSTRFEVEEMNWMPTEAKSQKATRASTKKKCKRQFLFDIHSERPLGAGIRGRCTEHHGAHRPRRQVLLSRSTLGHQLQSLFSLFLFSIYFFNSFVIFLLSTRHSLPAPSSLQSQTEYKPTYPQ